MPENRWEKYRVNSDAGTNKWEKYRVNKEGAEQPSVPFAPPNKPYNMYEEANPLVGGSLAALAGIKHTFDKPIHGLAQLLGASDWAKNRSAESERHFNQAEEAYPFLANAGKYGYELARDMPLMVASGAGAARAIPGALRGSAVGNFLQSILGGALGGGAVGGANYVNEDESRLENTLQGAAAGAIGSGAMHVGSGLVKGAANAVKAYPLAGAKSLADKVAVLEKGNFKKQSNALYNSLKNIAKEKGVKVSVKSPTSELKLALKNMKPNERVPLKNLIKKQGYSFDDAHELYKALGQAANRLAPDSGKTGVGAGRDAILKLQHKVENAMSKSLVKAGLPEQVGKLQTANKFYMDNVVPYNNKLIHKYLKNKIPANSFLNKLGGNDEFLAQLGDRYPEIEMRKKLPYYLKNLGIAGGIGAGVNQAYNLLKGGSKNSPYSE